MADTLRRTRGPRRHEAILERYNRGDSDRICSIASLIAMAILAGLSATGSQTGALYNRIVAATNTAR
jgi:hypothetical protein